MLSFSLVAEALTGPIYPSRSPKAMEPGEVNGWHTSVLTPANEDVYAKQYENKDAEFKLFIPE